MDITKLTHKELTILLKAIKNTPYIKRGFAEQELKDAILNELKSRQENDIRTNKSRH